MHILRRFHFKEGTIYTYEEETSKPLMSIGKIVVYNGATFEWVLYGSDLAPYDYYLDYSEISPTKYPNIVPDEIISMTDIYKPKCDCGGVTAATTHAHWCSTNGVTL